MRAGWLALLGLLACDAAPDGEAARDQGSDVGRDAALPDAAPPDAAPPDAALPDAALPDLGPPDAAPPDLGPPPPPTGLPRFAFPIHPDERHLILATPVFGIDHDPAAGQPAVCTNYAGRGFPHCYDGHEGTDFVLQGSFATMDRGSARVVAAAGGEVFAVEDGHYDRCHASAQTVDVSCDGHPMRANLVKIRHFGGWETHYLHLKNGSVAVQVGDAVTCGTELGRVGSSGRSSFPHLHFAVIDPQGAVAEPYAGPQSQPESLWAQQAEMGALPGDVCDRAWGAWPPTE
jgi:murein DD-endopeptidase MepM/ murein hydrolase activator NlpD